MIVSRDHTDGTILIIATEKGLDAPMMRSPDGQWRIGVALADELEDAFTPVLDVEERDTLVSEARAALTELERPFKKNIEQDQDGKDLNSATTAKKLSAG